ncbi:MULTISPECIES: hypothetical protein [unclassified Tolypothrix]|uniref:hypothetical protein n=1 Tax=unclassified Tolypothrix TaxID=2649714 RepID=UPI0005EAA934|nr:MULTISPECIES: hypothetical protein [unclassified Tolypothrix]EKE98727.1 hypothetical protein FDUTEX481_03805 [Tolypothrix sp. PCC 7601]MBE9086711.1 hypothetical protein [Tolypothrix sp. LEGE 11397]UYD33525.1 hypothetical protein HG267_32165 [Tolypothrix sp. PCC 7601]
MHRRDESRLYKSLVYFLIPYPLWQLTTSTKKLQYLKALTGISNYSTTKINSQG